MMAVVDDNMTNRKVRAGATYIYYPVFLDRNRPAQYRRLVPGDVVTVVNLPGCPKANTMGHAHVQLGGEFAGLVCTNSLYPFSDRQLVIDAMKRDAEKAAQ